MAVTATLNVSGVAALSYTLVDTTTFYFTNAVDGQQLRLTLTQDATGSRAIVSGNCPGIEQPSGTAKDNTTQVLIYDASSNSWNKTTTPLASGMVQNSYTTSTTIAWAKGMYLMTSSATFNLTVTNPVAGPPGIGNDGETMEFINLSAKTNGVTMGTTQTINSSSTSAAMAGTIGTYLKLTAFGGKVYISGANGAITLS